MTPKQRERLVAKAVKRMHAAADALSELNSMTREFDDVDTSREEHFIDGLKERANYWGESTWWKKP